MTYSKLRFTSLINLRLQYQSEGRMQMSKYWSRVEMVCDPDFDSYWWYILIIYLNREFIWKFMLRSLSCLLLVFSSLEKGKFVTTKCTATSDLFWNIHVLTSLFYCKCAHINKKKISELLRIKTTKVIQKCIIKGEIMVDSKQDVMKARVFTRNPCILVDQIDNIIKKLNSS